MAFVKFNKRKNDKKTSMSKSIVESYRQNWKVKHKQLANISFLSDKDAHILNDVLKWKQFCKTEDIQKPIWAKPYGHIKLIYEAIKQCGIYDAIEETWKNNYLNEILTLIINRLTEPRSRNSIADSWYEKSCLPVILKHDKIDLSRLYDALEHISKQHIWIEDKLYKQNKTNTRLIIYDITSTYFEWQKCSIATWWYDRDGNKKSKKIVVIWVIVDEKWKPISVEIFKWNTPDTKTVKKKIIELKKRFGIKKVLLVVDRGMNISCNLEKLNKWQETWKYDKKDKKEFELLEDELWELNLSDIDYITALKKNEVRKLVKNKIITISDTNLFTEETSLEYNDAESGKKFVCTYNETLLEKDINIRERKIKKTKAWLEKIKKSLKAWNIKSRDELLRRIWLWSKKYGVEDMFIIDVPKNKIDFSYYMDEDEIKEDKKLDGWYTLVCTDKTISKKDIVKIYREKDVIEKWFEIMKDQMELRPVRLRNEKRVKWHIFTCFLALYVKRYIKDKLWDLLNRHTRMTVFDELEQYSILKYEYVINKETVSYYTYTQYTMMQKDIYLRLGLDIDEMVECSP